MHCKYCGAKVPDDSEFCEKCGKKIVSDIKKIKKPEAGKKKSKKKLGIILGITIPIVLAIIFVSALAVIGSLPDESEISLETEITDQSSTEYEIVEWEYDETDEETTQEPQRTEDEILWSEAGNHIGETLTVYGPVVNTRYAEGSDHKLTFLYVGGDCYYKGEECFSVIIEEQNRSNFPEAPEEYYMGKHISVYGEIIEYEGTPEIVIYDTDQIGIEGSTEECMLYFNQDNIYEISQEYLDEGYPHYSIHCPDGWSFNEYIDFFGYVSDSFGSLTTKLEKNSGEIIDSMPKFGISVIILNDEYNATDDKSMIDDIFSPWWRDEVSATDDIDESLDNNIYSYSLWDSEGNEWVINYDVTQSGDDTFIYQVWGTGPEYQACIDYLFNSFNDDRLYIEE